MKTIIAAFLFASVSTQVNSDDGQTLYWDPSRDIQVRYEFTPAGVEFSADLPAGWSFTVSIDGDRNGAWGNGPGFEAAARGPTADRKFGQDAGDRTLCAQSILSSIPNQPDQVFVSTRCGGYPSRGRAETGQPDARGRTRIRLIIPAREVFDDHPDAHLQVCVWDTRRASCQHTPTEPFVLRRPAAQPPNVT
jgi:hypothetical protein